MLTEEPLQSPVRLAGVGSEPAREGRNQQRYTVGGTRLVAGCVPYHRDAATGQVQVLLISNRNKTQWIIPKGGWEADESQEQAALRESYEEAGVRGRIGPRLVTYTHTGKGGHKQSHAYYALHVDEVLTEWPDHQTRHRCWVSVQEAALLCTRKGMCDAILKLQRMFPTTVEDTEAAGKIINGMVLSPTILSDESPTEDEGVPHHERLQYDNNDDDEEE